VVAAAEAFCAAPFRSSNKPNIQIMAQSISQAKRALAFALNRLVPLHVFLVLNSHHILFFTCNKTTNSARFIYYLLCYVQWCRRGYAVASDVSSLSSSARGGVSGIEKGVAKNGSGPSGASSAWAPDPVTGYYRPINHRDEIDPVDLRNMLLNHKGKSS